MYKPIKFKPETACDNCGRFGAFDLGDQHLCSDCYIECGSCCMEFGGNDLWKKDVGNDNSKESTKEVNKKNK